MFSPCLIILVKFRTDPVLVLVYSNLAVVWSDGWCNATKEIQRIVVDSDPIPNIAVNHTFGIKVITVGKSCNKYGHLRCLIWIPAVVDQKLLAGIIEFQVNAWISLDMKSDVF